MFLMQLMLGAILAQAELHPGGFCQDGSGARFPSFVSDHAKCRGKTTVSLAPPELADAIAQVTKVVLKDPILPS